MPNQEQRRCGRLTDGFEYNPLHVLAQIELDGYGHLPHLPRSKPVTGHNICDTACLDQDMQRRESVR